MTEIVRILLLMYPRIPAEAGMLGRLLTAFEANPAFTPSRWGTNEQVRRSYSASEALAACEASNARFQAIFLSRPRVVKYSGYFDFARLPFVSFDFHKSFPAHRWSDILELADRVAAAVKPRLGILHIFRPTGQQWCTETDRLKRWMTFAAHPIPVRFRRYGPLGVGMRTYLGSDILEMFGRDLLLTSPALAEELSWSGVRLDLGEDMWNADPDEVVMQWKKVMDHLKQANALAEPEFEEDGRTVSFRPSPAWLNRRETSKPPRAIK
jgi:hypothetical protein